MTLLLIFGAATAALAAIFFNIARINVVFINDRFLEGSCSSIREAYIRISEEYEQQQYELSYARYLFNQRAEMIIINYCEQVYGGVENTPFEKYAVLRRQVEKLNKNFKIAYGIAG